MAQKDLQGVYRSTNGASTWEPTGIPLNNAKIKAIELINNVLLASGNPIFPAKVGGVYASVDRGLSWSLAAGAIEGKLASTFLAHTDGAIRYQLPVGGKVTLKVFDLLGRQTLALEDENEREAGYYEAVVDLSSMASGVYFYRIAVGGEQKFTATMKMLLVK